jgi:CheY-like chemotaxis protein
MKPKILLVEDNDCNRYLVNFLLEREGRIAPKVLLPGRGARERQNHTLCQKLGYRGRNG